MCFLFFCPFINLLETIYRKKTGFTLLELLLTISILAIIAGFGVSSYRNYGKNAELELTGKSIINDLRHIRIKASSGNERRAWGIHFVNGMDDYYELFSTPTTYSDGSKIITDTIYLPRSVELNNPSEGMTTDILFSSITGATTNHSITIESEGVQKTITVTTSGTVY